MKHSQLLRAATAALGLTALAAQATDPVCADCYTKVKPYAVAVSPDYAIQPLLSVGERVPLTSDATKEYQFVGIPDGLGLHRLPYGKAALFMNHEFGNTIQSVPVIGGVTNRGAIVSRFVLDQNGCVLSGELAYNSIYDTATGTTLPVPGVGNSTPGFGRFCSGSLHWRDAGFDVPVYFCGEESGAGSTYDPKGGLAVAIINNVLYTLPNFGYFPWENIVAQPKPGRRTVLMGNEDGPSSPDSQLYMFVGEKNPLSINPLDRNGLNNGRMYVLKSTTPGVNDDNTFTGGSISAAWAEITNAASLNEAQLEAASDAVGAYGFIRIEDGSFDKKNPDTYYFVTTGAVGSNKLGRVYELNLNKLDPTGPCTLKIKVNADLVDAAGGDTVFSPDNVATSKDYLMVQEDGTGTSRPKMTQRAREGSIWRFDLKQNFAATRVVELNPPGTIPAPGTNVPPVITAGVWETSGIIDVADFFGKDSWLFDVQAHAPTIAPAPGTVEDGQLLLMKRSRAFRGDDDDDRR